MPKKMTNVDIWVVKEDGHIRKALENASTYFDDKDVLNVNTLEAIYAKESSFGTKLNNRGISAAAGEFQLQKSLAEHYGLYVSKDNDQRFDIDYSSIAAARYLKDIDYAFSKRTNLGTKLFTYPIIDPVEREKFDFAAYTGGQGTIGKAQQLASKAGKDPTRWDAVKDFLMPSKDISADTINKIKGYVPRVSEYEAEFAKKSQADKKAKDKKFIKPKIQCTKGHWITKDHLHIFICK
ncbi:MAG: transglycosylase SLT domain-containing protein [Candidatus Omnitrophica bacterium]|nr:transglycosylase SLT domain-containing protein [Candidatus Omnitrophota bacterium]